MSATQIIAGPAIIQHGGQTYYTEGDITVNLNRETFLVSTALHGTIDERLLSQLAEISFKPVGALDVVAKYLPYAASLVGSLLIDQADPDTVVVWAKDGKKTTWACGFISRLPDFSLSAISAGTIGDMTITCVGDPTEDLDHAAAWNSIADDALDDTSFDETKIVTPRYLATWGSIFVDLESEDGFTFQTSISLSAKKTANRGVINFMLTDIVFACRFKPVGLTEADLWAALSLQNTGAKQPGDSLSSASDLVVSGGSVSFTLAKAGMKSGVTQYGLEPLRLGEVAFVNRKTWSAGVLNAPLTVSFPS